MSERCTTDCYLGGLRAMSSRPPEHQEEHSDVALSIGVQLMVWSDLAGSGVMFSIDTETGFLRVPVISAARGLGEAVMQDRTAVTSQTAIDGSLVMTSPRAVQGEIPNSASSDRAG